MAHIPDGFLSAPVIAGTAAVSVAALAVAGRRSKQQLGEREATTLGATTAFVFAAQMLNFPLGVGTSAHLLGGVLVAAILGPWSAMLVMFSVLLVQALLFQDGGIAALGANTLNMAVLSVGVGYGVYRWVLTLVGMGIRAHVFAVSVAAFLSTVVVGAAVAAELSLSGTVPLGTATAVIVGSFVVLALGEAVLSGAILGVIYRTQPQLVSSRIAPSTSVRRRALAITAISLGLGVVAVYIASTRPDALDAAAESLGIGELALTRHLGPFADYTAPVGGPWVAAVVGVVVVFLLGWGVARVASYVADRDQ